MQFRLALATLALALTACGPASLRDDAGVTIDAAGSPAIDSSMAPTCDASAPDQEGCPCDPAAPPRACYPKSAEPTTRHVGVCTDGTQSCGGTGEILTYGPCTGATVPGAESCTNGLDDSCDGTIDCADPTCATNPVCDTACTNGMMRACYDGPAGTLDVGACHGGMQTCSGGMWGTSCPGEQLPGTEDCASPNDLDCNHLPGCFDIFACVASPACMETCKVTMPGCVCPTGSGDVATCPEGTHGVSMGTFPDTVECCPCSASDCGDPGCCAETACAGNAACGGLTCNTLPPSCMGQVNFDCDDFPEDCDEPCCKCTSCQ